MVNGYKLSTAIEQISLNLLPQACSEGKEIDDRIDLIDPIHPKQLQKLKSLISSVWLTG